MLKAGTYQHFKGSDYKVLYVGRHSETEEYMVVYHPAETPEDIWLRPLAMFDEVIERNGKQIKRFSFIKP